MLPTMVSKPERKPFSTLMDTKLRERFHVRCDERGLNIYWVIETLVREWLEKTGKEVEHG